MPSTPTTSMWAFRSSERPSRPPPEPTARAITFGRPGAASSHRDLEPGPFEPPGCEGGDVRLSGAARDEIGVDRVDRDQCREELGYRVHAGSSSIHGSPGSGMRAGWSRKASCSTPWASRGAGRE